MTAEVQLLDQFGQPLGTAANPVQVALAAGSVIAENLTKVGGTDQTARDWSTDFAKLQNLDIATTALRDAIRGGSSKTLTDIVTALQAVVLAAGTATIGKVDQGVAGASPWAVTGPLTDTQLRASAVPISNTNLDIALSVLRDALRGAGSKSFTDIAAQLDITLSALRDALRGAGNKTLSDVVTGLGAVVLAAGSAMIGSVTQSGNWSVRNQDGSGNAIDSLAANLVGTERGLAVRNIPKAADLAVTATAAAAAGVTLTLPAAGAGLFHYITSLEITLFAAAAGTAAATPVIVTSTNLPGSLAWSFEAKAAAVGERASIMVPLLVPLKVSAANTATTIVCPASASRIWRVNATYYAAP